MGNCPECDHPQHGTDRCECYVDYPCSRSEKCPGGPCCEAPCPCGGVL